ncbi:hypothetical protein Tco_0872385, partial [Tanacetum coccineum]
MSSASSAVTYTSVYTDSEPGRVFWGADEEISDGGVPRVIVLGYDGLPMQPVDPPSPDYVPGPEHPASPDYVPGPEHPPSPIEIPFVPEPEYPEYLVPSEDEAPMEDQPLPADASPVALSPGYVPDSDPEEDSEEEHVDYPADGEDRDDEPSGDDTDDDDADDDDEEPFEDEEDDEEEEEHLAPVDSSVSFEIFLLSIFFHLLSLNSTSCAFSRKRFLSFCSRFFRHFFHFLLCIKPSSSSILFRRLTFFSFHALNLLVNMLV